MSALAELDRYIKENEITLYSINQKKLSRNSFVHPNKDNTSVDVTNRSLASLSRVQHGTSSVENELNNFITRLKQMQQFRLAQFQQVNALFVHDMEIEDQFDMNVATAVERNEQTAEEEFEAFLLGESKQQDKSAPSKAQYVPPPPQSTLFSRHSLSQDAKAKTSNTNGGTNTDSGGDKVDIQEEDLVSDDAVVRLKKNRRDRSAQLRSIVESMTMMGLDDNNNDSENLSASAANRSEWSHISRDTEEKLISLRRSVLDTSHISVTVHNPANTTTPQRPNTNMQELPPPPPPPVYETDEHAVLTERTAQSAASRVVEPSAPAVNVAPQQRTAQPSQTSAIITLQSILDDEQFDIVDSYNSAPKGVVEGPTVITVPSGGGRNAENRPSTAHPVKKTKANTAAAPFLVSNIRRKSLEQGLAAESEQDRSMSTIHSNPYSRPVSRHQRKNKAAANISLPHTDVVGIGFGDRYAERAGDVNQQLLQLAEEACEISSIGSQDSGQDSGSGESAHFHLSSMRRSGNNLFEYADQLESPVKKKYAGVSFAADIHHSVENVQHASSGGSSAVNTGDTRVNESIRKAAQFTHHVSDYYEHRIHNLEASGGYAGSPKNIDTYVSRNDYSREFASPERAVRSRTEHEYDSPTPKTPTFAPIFS